MKQDLNDNHGINMPLDEDKIELNADQDGSRSELIL